MSNEKNNIDELFRGKLGNFSVETPEHVWKGIEASRTPLHRAINYFKGKKGVAIGSFILLATVTGITYFINTDTDILQQTARVYTIQKHNHTIQAAKLDNSTPLKINNSKAVLIKNYTNNTSANIDTKTNHLPLATQNNGGAAKQDITPQKGSAATLVTGIETNTIIPTHKKATTKNTTNSAALAKDEQPKNDANLTASTSTKSEAIEKIDNKGAEKDKETIEPTKNSTALTTTVLPPKNEGIEKTNKTDKSAKQSKAAIEPPKNFSKFMVDMYAGSNYAMRTLKSSGIAPTYVEAKRNAESYTLGMMLGARINYAVKEFLTLRAGVQYSRFNQRINLEREYQYTTTETVTGIILDPVTQQPIGTTTRIDTVERTEMAKANTTNTISFIDVPIQVELNLYKTNKFSLFATTGAAINLRFTQKGHLLNERLTGINEFSSANNPYKTTAGINILAGIGVNYKLNKRYSILFETTYQHGISNVMKVSAGMRQNYRIITGSVGLRYRF